MKGADDMAVGPGGVRRWWRRIRRSADPPVICRLPVLSRILFFFFFKTTIKCRFLFLYIL
jgi:hypothetical protein